MNYNNNIIKEKELNILKSFIAITKKYNLTYFVIGGTLLGSIRHRGFIPWDDDIDVGMPRKDYETFLKVAQKELDSNLFLQTHYTDKEYLNNFAKIRDSSTTFREITSKNLNINHGVYIDIFPLDGYPKNIILKKIISITNKTLSIKISSKFNIESRTLKSKIALIISNIIYPISVNQAIAKREQLMKSYSYDLSNEIANFCGAWGKKEIMPKDFFGCGGIGYFEGIKVIVPKKYDEYLSHLYGNYMKTPPKEQQIPHHYCDIIDMDNSYLEYKDK